jgi:hypothetical protein
MLPQCGHLVLERHQRLSGLPDLLLGQATVFHPALHQLAQQFRNGQHQGTQVFPCRLRAGIQADLACHRGRSPEDRPGC